MESRISVKVMIPRNRLSQLYTQCSEWLRELEASEEKEASLEWGAGDSILAQSLYAAISTPAQKILDFLIERPGEKFSVDDLLLELKPELDFKSVGRLTGSLSSITKRAKDAGKDRPYKYDREESLYWLDPEVAKLFRQAREGAPKRRGVAHLQQWDEDVSQEEAPRPEAG